VAHSRITMQIEAAGVFQQLVHVVNANGHSGEVGHGRVGGANAAKSAEVFPQVLIEVCDLAERIEVAHVAPRIGKGGLLRGGVLHVNALEEDIVVALAVEGRVYVDEVNERLRVLRTQLLEDIEAVSIVEVVELHGAKINSVKLLQGRSKTCG